MTDFNLTKKKNDILGELDYLNSFIGLAKSYLRDKKIKRILTDIQNDIFVMQATIADPKEVIHRPHHITSHRIFALQKETYFIECHLETLHHFIIPDGTTAACMIHCVRTVARNIERKIPGYLKAPANVAMYLDRVACFMYALARKINKESGVSEEAPSYVARESNKKINKKEPSFRRSK